MLGFDENSSSFYSSERLREAGNHKIAHLPSESLAAAYQVRNSVLMRIRDLLLKGEKRLAYRYALDEKMWAHAMVISSSMDKDSFQSAVNEFITAELGVQIGIPQRSFNLDGMGSTLNGEYAVNGLESLRVAYSLFSGQGPSSGKQICTCCF